MSDRIPRVYRVEEIAQLIASSPKHILELLEAGRLRGFEVGGEWRVTEQALLELMGESPDPPVSTGPGPINTRPVVLRRRSIEPAAVLGHREDWERANGFSYTWPKRRSDPEPNVESYSEAWEWEAQLDGESIRLLIGFTIRPCAGMQDRQRAVVFLASRGKSLIPLVEFVGANDFRATTLMASVIKLPRRPGGGHLHLRPGMDIPEEYASGDVQIGVYSDVVRGPNAASSVAVLATKAELDVMAYHALIRALWKDLL